MKLSEILGRILTDYDLRQEFTRSGVCSIVSGVAFSNVHEMSASEYDAAYKAVMSFNLASDACRQTESPAYPVAPAGCPELHIAEFDAAYSAYFAAGPDCPRCQVGNMWRGKYGQNRRRFVRDCWRWAKERGL
uniref:Uncharacterized protein n=3 Tax=unclassified bacterial viruses TaxID=12333 RepID=A0AAU6W202_9VIRU